ncbi:sulfotransferase 6B1-like, partial [Leptonychotes weddellii]|uniref:Sulfotransferase n=1 Tax=Leptonychotes weddellii TaxID=9713 RepID=A0A2U3Z8B8_LEPWE
GSNWILHIISELIFAESKKKYEYPEFPILECGDPEKYQLATVLPSIPFSSRRRLNKTATVSWGSYFDFAINWNKHLDDENVKFLLYEDLKKNLAAGIKQIAEFFGFSLTGEQIQTISAQSTFHATQAKSQETHGAVGLFLFRKGKVTLVSGTPTIC